VRRPAVAAAGALLLSFAASPTSAAANFMAVESMDTDGDGTVDRQEYMLTARDALDSGGFGKAFRRRMYQFVMLMYDICDLDAHGVLCKREVEFLERMMRAATRSEMEMATGSAPMPAHADDSMFGGDRTMRMLGMLDLDGDSFVNREEFMRLAWASMSGWGEVLTEGDFFQEAIDDMFDHADVSGDGLLQLRGLQFAAFSMREFILTQMTESMFYGLDADGDGRIELAEVEDEAYRLAEAMVERRRAELSQARA